LFNQESHQEQEQFLNHRSGLHCAEAGVQESTPAGVGVFQQEQDQEWIFSIGTGSGLGVIFNHNVFEICIDYLHSTQFVTWGNKSRSR